jgi:hypothetical protein
VIDNLDLGRPDTVEIVFGRRIINGKQRAAQGTFRTKVITRGTEVTINAFYGHVYLDWTAEALGMRIAGVTSLVAGDDGRIASVAIHHRPLAAVIAFSDEMRRRLEGQVDPSHFHAASAGAET